MEEPTGKEKILSTAESRVKDWEKPEEWREKEVATLVRGCKEGKVNGPGDCNGGRVASGSGKAM